MIGVQCFPILLNPVASLHKKDKHHLFGFKKTQALLCALACGQRRREKITELQEFRAKVRKVIHFVHIWIGFMFHMLKLKL